ncbi:hypothetical protein FOA52_002673 [Chlamydomonas sp. UWO 241]|nr:hypothetical protein FOA52_002673 [Chlamydomonas sp. UWO 241]
MGGGLGAATAATSACVRSPSGRGCVVVARAAQQEQLVAQAKQDEQQQEQQQQGQQQQGQQQMGRQAGPGGATTYQLPPHWKKQIDKAPMGKKRVLQSYYERLASINDFEAGMIALSDEQLAAKTDEFRDRLDAGESEEGLLEEAFAVVREASWRVLSMRHFDCQLVGGMVLHEGMIAEMSTGEGKTLVATLPTYLNALRRGAGGVHVVTVNDYLALRDSEWMGKVYRFLGLSCSAVQSGMSTDQYRSAFACDVVYVTGQELGFTYLRDNTALGEEDLALPDRLNFAVVDEVDSILIDESRNPMIISTAVYQNEEVVRLVDSAVRSLWEELNQRVEQVIAGYKSTPDAKARQELAKCAKKFYYAVDEKARSVSLTPLGLQEVFVRLLDAGAEFVTARKEGRPPTLMDMWEGEVPWGQLALTSLKAYELFQEGKQYIVRGGEVVVIDESTGRLRPITRWQGGLHQAVEAKEGCGIKQETHPTAQITFQVFFKFYNKLAGMTGTATPAAAEFFELYRLKVVTVPTNRPSLRADLPPRLYFDTQAKHRYLCAVVQQCWSTGRPLLIGTTSVRESETILSTLMQYTEPRYHHHLASVQLLNAKPDKVRMESEVIAQAGLPGCVTIATNMAGRGTDIILGGNPQGLARLVLMRLVYRRLLSDAEEAAGVPMMPLQEFDVYDSPEGSDLQSALSAYPSVEEHASLPEDLQLPRDLHLNLLRSVMLAVAKRRVGASAGVDAAGLPLPTEGLLTYTEATALLSWVMDQADGLKGQVYAHLRSRFGTDKVEDLEFSVCIAPVAEEVAAEAERNATDEVPAGQAFTARCALLLWLWLEQYCARAAERVRLNGGLLVIGTSINESARIELQLAGRAGRQGDPGQSLMLYDFMDPLIEVYGLGAMSQVVNQVDSSDEDGPLYVDGLLVHTLVSGVRRPLDSVHQMSRWEAKRYDEVVEEYRRSIYSLRRLMLRGSAQQRTQVIYMFIQMWADRTVSETLDANGGPLSWVTPTLPPPGAAAAAAASAQGSPPAPNGASSSSSSSGGGGGASSSIGGGAGGGGTSAGALVSPIALLLQRAFRLVNPEGMTASTQVEFREVQDGVSKDVTVQKVLSMFGALQQPNKPPGGSDGDGYGGDEDGGGGDGSVGMAQLRLDLEELPLMSPQQVAQLAAFATGTADDLPWPEPRIRAGVRQSLALATHAAIFGMVLPTAAGGAEVAIFGMGLPTAAGGAEVGG